MDKITADIIGLITHAHKAAYPHSDVLDGLDSSLSLPDQAFGDIASSIAMRIAATEQEIPREVAHKLVEHMPTGELVAEITIAGAGFINFRLAPAAMTTLLSELFSASQARELVRRSGKGKKVAMDYSHPNIGKPMGVHHLLSTIIGDSLKRTMREAGYEVIADNFIGDLGTQFGKLIWAVKQWGNTEAIEADPITELQKLYVKFHIEADSDVVLDEAARAEYLKLEQGDEENRALWHKIVAWSKAEIQPIYDELGVEFDYLHGESFYEDKMDPLLERGIRENVFVESQGALVCMSDNPDQPPAILRKGDGATLYLTRDLARVAYWEQAWQPDIMMVVVDAAQSFAQSQLYMVARKLHLSDAQLVQVNFGRMRFADGGMSTRKGNILLLKDLIAEAKTRALALVQDKSHDMSEDELRDTANKLAISSIKYNILSQNRTSDITFDWSTMLNFEGNSAPYLAYTLVRLRSLLAKGQGTNDSDANSRTYAWGEVVEREVVLQLAEYDTVFLRALKEHKPSHLTTYAFTLAQQYNNLYNRLPILQADEVTRALRLQLSSAVRATLEHCFDCLGLVTPDRM